MSDQVGNHENKFSHYGVQLSKLLDLQIQIKAKPEHTESASLCCSRKAENSTSLTFGPAILRPCHAGCTSLGIEVGGLMSNPYPGPYGGFTLKYQNIYTCT